MKSISSMKYQCQKVGSANSPFFYAIGLGTYQAKTAVALYYCIDELVHTLGVQEVQAAIAKDLKSLHEGERLDKAQAQVLNLERKLRRIKELIEQ